jgi:bis(5'-nucleosyl)-tetraphosphatase (symmetrical)
LTRHLFIGDVQGCRVELEKLLEELDFDPARDALHPVGDLVNRGPDSLGTLRLLRDLDARAVLGNHDLHLLRVAHGTRELRPSDTLDDVLAAPDRDELLAWLRAQPFLREAGDLVQVHAGLHPDWRDPALVLADRDPLVPDPDTDFATRVRTCSPSGERPAGDDPSADPRFAPWFDHLDTPSRRTIVFGHWAARGLVVRPGLRGLDTGCVWGGRLTAWVAEEDRLADVAAEKAYCRVGSSD